MIESDKNLMFLVALLGGACFAIVYKIPKRYFIHATLLAMLAKVGVDLVAEKSQLAFATFLVTFVVAAISHLFARSTGKPAQAFLIPGVMYLVPGTSLYRSFAAALTGDYTLTTTTLVQAITVTASISFALLLANWVVPSKRML